jgi:hypothetical protein
MEKMLGQAPVGIEEWQANAEKGTEACNCF